MEYRNMRLTQREVYFVKQLREGYFPVTVLHRDDLAESKRFDGVSATDDQMEEIACRMNRSFLDCGYWESLESAAEDILTPINEEEEKAWIKILEMPLQADLPTQGL